MLAILGSTDLTKLIDKDSYSIESTAEYKEWQNGNDIYSRIYTRERVSGSFNVLLKSDWTLMTDTEFLQLLADNTNNNVTTITLWVNNKAKMESIECYVDVTTSSINYIGEDRCVVYKVSIEER